jgi:hypothetical protein
MLRRGSGFLTGLFMLLAVLPAFGQGGRSEINGTVFDSGKAVLPGVTITITDERTGLERTVVSGDEGRFVIPTLVPSTYTVKAELAGFQATTQTGLVLNVGQELTVNVTLQVAGVQETLTVTGQSPLVEPTSSRIGANITNAEIDSLPASGRNQLSLMQVVPGLTPSLTPGSFEGGQFNANGQTTTSNLFLVDGAYDNDDRRGGSQGTQARVTLDTMSEFQVMTHQYSAEYGGSSGVVVNAVTRSGANQLSGRVFEYFQDNKLNKTDYFLKQAGRENPDSGSNVWGGSAGGPIVLGRQRRRSDRQKQGVLVRQRRADISSRSGEPEFPLGCGATRHVVLRHDRIFRLEHVHSRRHSGDEQQPLERSMGTRGGADQERRARRQPQHTVERDVRKRQRRSGAQLLVGDRSWQFSHQRD